MGIQLNGTSGTDVISAVDGSLTIDGDISVVDKIIHGGDTNTFIRFPAADTFAVETAGSERVRIDSNGNMALGTSSANNYSNYTTFTINGTTGGQIDVESNGTKYGDIFTQSNAFHVRNKQDSGSGFLAFHTTSSGTCAEKLRITSDGYVLAGHTTRDANIAHGTAGRMQLWGTSWANAGIALINTQASTDPAFLSFAKSRKASATASAAAVQSGDRLGEIRFAGDDGTDMHSFGASISAYAQGTIAGNRMPGKLIFATTSDTAGAVNSSTRMVLYPSGQIDLGTGVVNIASFCKTGNNHQIVGQAADDVAALDVYSQHGNDADRLSFAVSDNRTGSKSNAFVVKGNGYVGINEDTPACQLHVEHDNAHSSTYYLNSDAGIMIDNKNGSGRSILKLEGDAAIVYGGPGGDLIFSDRQTERFRIASDGKWTIKNANGMMIDLQSSAGTGMAWIEFSDTDGTRKGYFGYGSSGSEKAYWVQQKAANMSMYSNGSDRFEVQSDGTKIVKNGNLNILSTYIDFSGSISTPSTAAAIYRPADNTLAFSTANVERLRIANNGDILFGNYLGTTNQPRVFFLSEDGNFPDQTNKLGLRISNGYNDASIRAYSNSNNWNHVKFYSTHTGSIVTAGSISQSGGNTIAYNTSSDYRLKENEVAISDGITRLKQLKPYRFNFKSNTSQIVDGFFAHEVSGIVPEAITGEKDGVVTQTMIDAGEIDEAIGTPVYQQIDQAKLVPLLTATLQEAITKIETLEAKVAALEGS